MYDNNRILTLVPNQKKITVNKAPANKDNLYFTSNVEATFKAMQTLKLAGLKLWLYLNKNQDQHVMALSSADAIDKTGMSPASYSRAVKELISNRYLVQTKEGSNHYYFYEAGGSINDISNQNDSNMIYQIDNQQCQNKNLLDQNEKQTYQSYGGNNTDKTDNTNNTTEIGCGDIYNSCMDKFFDLYGLTQKNRLSSLEYFWGVVGENEIPLDRVNEMLDLWAERYTDLENNRPSSIKVPFRYDLKIICDSFNDILAEEKWEVEEEELEIKRCANEKTDEEENKWQVKCNTIAEELNDFKNVFEFFKMSNDDIARLADKTKEMLSKRNIEKSQWKELSEVWMNSIQNSEYTISRSTYGYKKGLQHAITDYQTMQLNLW